MIPKSNFNGKGKKLKEFHTVTGKKVEGTCTQYGSVVLVSRKIMSSRYIRLYTTTGLLFNIISHSPVNGKIRAAQHVARRIAAMTDWVKANEDGVVSEAEAQQLRNQIYQIIREKTK